MTDSPSTTTHTSKARSVIPDPHHIKVSVACLHFGIFAPIHINIFTLRSTVFPKQQAVWITLMCRGTLCSCRDWVLDFLTANWVTRIITPSPDVVAMTYLSKESVCFIFLIPFEQTFRDFFSFLEDKFTQTHTFSLEKIFTRSFWIRVDTKKQGNRCLTFIVLQLNKY